MRLIALTGGARTGKSRAAAVLRDRVLTPTKVSGDAWHWELRNPSTVLLGFADGLKAAAACIAPEYDPSDDYSKLREVLPGVTGRKLLEQLGSACRALHPDVFILEVASTLRTDPDARDADWVILTDLRYENEARWVHDRGGIVVRTTRPPAGPNGGDPTHSSQSPLTQSLVDYHLLNDQEDEQTAASWRSILNIRGWL
jgi:hypothetical protein